MDTAQIMEMFNVFCENIRKTEVICIANCKQRNWENFTCGRKRIGIGNNGKCDYFEPVKENEDETQNQKTHA